MKTKVGMLVLAAMMAAVSYAETFGTGANEFSIDFVNIGYAGNAADASGYGAVGYDYRMGTYEVTINQFDKANAAVGGNLLGDGDNNPFSIGVNGPVGRTSWFEAAKFANYLTSGTYNGGAYQFSDANTLIGVNRDAAVSTYGTVYVLPTEDEWYKAAYLKSDGSAYTTYATGNAIPVAGVLGENYNQVSIHPWDVGSGIAENNGTFDMNGNNREWNESAYDGTLDNMAEARVIRGGSFKSNTEDDLRSSNRGIIIGPLSEGGNMGFRVAAIPEPSSLAMIGLVSGCAVFVRRRFMI